MATPAYKPNFTYTTAARGEKLDVTLGIIAPQFSADSVLYQQANRTDEIVKGMLSAMKATFSEVLSAKGFDITGPFDSLDEMTFPDKQGTNLVLYPEFDFQVDVKLEKLGTKSAPPPEQKSTGFSLGNIITSGKSEQGSPTATTAPQIQTCEAVISVSGTMLFVAQEPLSKQRMWIKKLDLTTAAQSFGGLEGDACDGKKEHWAPDVRDAWAKAHEAVFQSGMKAFDNYVNGDEFKILKEQSIEARKKTTYGG